MRRTMELVDRQFHWRGIRRDTVQYVKTCPKCQLMKSDNRAEAGLLQPLEIPTKKWAHVATDLVTDFPESDGVCTMGSGVQFLHHPLPAIGITRNDYFSKT